MPRFMRNGKKLFMLRRRDTKTLYLSLKAMKQQKGFLMKWKN